MLQKNFNSLQFFQVFIDQNTVPCCQSKSCCLCRGNKFALISEEDHEMIGNMIFNRLNLRMKEIGKKIKTVKNIDQFLLYYLNQKYPYQMKVDLQSQITQNQQSAEFTIKYRNSGEINWPQETYLQCKSYENVKCKVKSLSANEEFNQVVSFLLPAVQQMDKIELEWQLMHQIYDIDHYFGPIIICEIEGNVKKKDLDFHKENMALYEKIKECFCININEADSILSAYKNKLLSENDIANYLLKE